MWSRPSRCNLSTLEAAWSKDKIGYKLFAKSLSTSVFDVAGDNLQSKLWWATFRRTNGAFVNRRIERCYAISEDAAEIASSCFGIKPEKLEVVSLGVDTDLWDQCAI